MGESVSEGRTTKGIASLYEAAIALMAERKYRNAKEILGPLVPAVGDPDPAFVAALGRCHWELQEWEDALRLCDRATQANPADVDSMHTAGRALKKLGRLAEALDRFAVLTRLFPDHTEGWNMYGACLRESGRFDESVAAYEVYLSRNPKAVEATNAYVMALAKAGQTDKARAAGQRLLEMKHENAMAFFAKEVDHPQLAPATKVFNPHRPKRNVICFSLWGQQPAYVTGAIVNARIGPLIYPGWTCRFYCDPDVPADALEQLRLAEAQVVMMPGPELARLKNMWRFFASDDPEVDFFLCRDTDSRLNVKEAIAVQAWLRSGKPFHVIRDNLFHMELMLAGMWGGMAGVLPNQRKMISEKTKSGFYHFGDQAYLARHVWPLIHDRVEQHDKFYAFNGGAPLACSYELAPWQHIGGSIKTNVPHWSTISYPIDDSNS